MKSEICAIFAIGPDNVIGIEDKMPWHSKQDFYHYKQMTKGYPCIFGDRTFFGLPDYPLKNRLNIVVSFEYKAGQAVWIGKKNEDETKEWLGGIIQMPSLEDAVAFASNYSKIFICGGRSIYKYCLENNVVDKIYLTKVESKTLSEDITKDPDKYIRFPLDIEEYTKDWNCKELNYSNEELPEEEGDILVKFYEYTKIKNS